MMSAKITAAALAALLTSCGIAPHSAPEVVPDACASGGGYALSDRAVACQGTFSGTLEAQCKSGWAPCTKSPLLPADCGKLAGFFAGARSATTSCGDAVDVLYGCGVVGTAPNACSAGFARRIPCPGRQTDPSPFSCQGFGVSNIDPKSGVLCCR